MSEYTYTELHDLVVEWGREKGIVVKGNQIKQLLKCASECGELADGICKNNHEEIKDAIGDVLVTLILFGKIFGIPVDVDVMALGKERSFQFMDQSEADAMFNLLLAIYAIYENTSKMLLTKAICWLNVIASKNDLDVVDCLESAYNVIKNRTGTTENGVFKKHE